MGKAAHWFHWLIMWRTVFTEHTDATECKDPYGLICRENFAPTAAFVNLLKVCFWFFSSFSRGKVELFMLFTRKSAQGGKNVILLMILTLNSGISFKSDFFLGTPRNLEQSLYSDWFTTRLVKRHGNMNAWTQTPIGQIHTIYLICLKYRGTELAAWK